MTSKEVTKAQNVINAFLEESYTLTEAAMFAGLTKQQLSTDFRSGKLNAVKFGRDVRVSKEDLYRYMYKRQDVVAMFKTLQAHGYGKDTLDDLVKYLESLES